MDFIKELPEKPKKKKSDLRGMWDALSINVGVLVLAPILLCLTLGILCDTLFASKPTFTVVFLFLGLIASLYNIYKLTKNK